jgi:hypothetical protein
MRLLNPRQQRPPQWAPLSNSRDLPTVQAARININTTDAAVSTVIDRDFVQNMPWNGRSFEDSEILVPGGRSSYRTELATALRSLSMVSATTEHRSLR